MSKIFRQKKISQKQIKQIQSQLKNKNSDQNLIKARLLARSRKKSKALLFDGTIVKADIYSNCSDVVAGDFVNLQQSYNANKIYYAVQSYQERKNSFYRFNEILSRKQILASNLDQVFVMFAPQPKMSTNLIDSFMIVANFFGLDFVLLANKKDLPYDENYQNILDYYEALGVNLVQIDSYQLDKDFFKTILSQKTSLIIGQSGVGKSTLISSLTDNQNIAIANFEKDEVHTSRHTTSQTQFYPLYGSQDSFIVDTAGLRYLFVYELSLNDIVSSYTEISEEYRCYFKNCEHNEADRYCKVTKAIDDGIISDWRVKNLYQILEYQKIVLKKIKNKEIRNEDD